MAATALVGYVGAISPLKRKRFLIVFMCLLIAAMFAELGLGGVIWFKTLRMRSLYKDKWQMVWPDTLKIAFQDMVRETLFSPSSSFVSLSSLFKATHLLFSPTLCDSLLNRHR